MIYLGLYLLIGFLLGGIHYFRNKSREIGAIAELVGIALVWLLLGVLYILAEAHRTLHSAGDGL